MREILFRGKRIDNGEWVEGGYRAEKVGGYITAVSIMEHLGHGAWNVYRVDPSTVGQYTGLTDKNGKKIFEGDIVDASGEWWCARGPAGHASPIIQVEWSDGFCGFEPFADYDCYRGVYIDASGCEVIGNIHDNPELLEVSHE